MKLVQADLQLILICPAERAGDLSVMTLAEIAKALEEEPGWEHRLRVEMQAPITGKAQLAAVRARMV